MTYETFNLNLHEFLTGIIPLLWLHSHLCESDFAGDFSVCDGGFTVVVQPPLSTEYIVDAAGNFAKFVVIAVPSRVKTRKERGWMRRHDWIDGVQSDDRDEWEQNQIDAVDVIWTPHERQCV